MKFVDDQAVENLQNIHIYIEMGCMVAKVKSKVNIDKKWMSVISK